MRFRCQAIWGVFFIGIVAAPSALRGGLSFDGTNQYVTFGTAKNLGSPTFTLETWFNWTGSGAAASTVNDGLTAIPLISKLSAEADGDNRDGNYFLGIRLPDGVLAADLEEGAAGASPGTNHPLAGVTAIRPNTWHHAAVTYNGTNWLLFLDAHLETSMFVGQPPRWDSIQHAALGSSLNSTGAPQGYFSGTLDEVRIWNYALSASQIASNKNLQIRSAFGLIGRWSFAETNGLIAHDSSGQGADGTLINGPHWFSNVRAAAEVVTPIKLSVIDPERTAAVRQTEANRVPALFRYDSGMSAQVENSFRANFRMNREKFLTSLKEMFPQRPANAPMDTDPRFAEMVTIFQTTNKTFPLNAKIAQNWARGRPDGAIQPELSARLHEIMARYICPDRLADEAKAGPATVRLYPLAFSQPTPDLATVQSQALSCSRTNLFSLSKARSDLRQRFSPAQEALANYLAGFLRENCTFDTELTRQTRARHAASFFAADHYEPGQTIVQKGQIIDGRINAALEELKTQLAAAESNARAAAEQIKTEKALTELQQRTTLSEFKSQLFSQQNRWLLAGLIIVAVTSSIAVWQLTRSRRAQSLLPMALDRREDAAVSGAPAETSTQHSDTVEWRQRALLAEKRAAQGSAAIRAGLLPHFAQWLRHKLIKGLVAERSDLLSTQQKAELELAELEERLAKVQAPMEQRLQLYHQRIAELERELAAKGQENRDLIEAKIVLTRKRLEAEQGKSG